MWATKQEINSIRNDILKSWESNEKIFFQITEAFTFLKKEIYKLERRIKNLEEKGK